MGTMREPFGEVRGCVMLRSRVMLKHWPRFAAMSAVLAMAVSCSDSGSSGGGSTTAALPAALSTSSSKDAFENWLNDHYTAQDVRHTFKTRFGETIDCIDFFAQSGVKELARRGRPVTTIPVPPPLRHPEKWARWADSPMSDYMFNGSLDEDGHSRTCPQGTVPELRTTVDQLRAAHTRYSGKDRHRHGPPKGQRPTKSGIGHPATTREATGTAHAAISPGRLGSPTTSPTFPPYPPQSDYCGYAHVVSSIYPGASASSSPLDTGTASFSIWDLAGTGNQVPDDGSHSLMQIWVTSGWNTYSGLTTMCGESSPGCGGSDPPCIESLEIGWDDDPFNASAMLLSNVYSPHLFGYATPDGYHSGCYDNNGLSGTCSVLWMKAASPPLLLGATLPSNVTLGTYSQEDLDIEVTYSSSEWWVYAAINGTPTAIGYYVTSDYTGPMASGQAQEFQAGGEVYDVAEETDLGTWNVKMGSSQSASEGYKNAAYVADLQSCTAADLCYEPTYSVSAVTVPSNYNYAVGITTPPEFGFEGFVGFFYVGTGKNTYTWWGGGEGVGIGTLPVGSTLPPTLLTATFPLALGANQITIAPRFIYDSSIGEEKFNFDVLTPIYNDDNPYNYQVEGFSTEPNGLGDPYNYRVTCGGDWEMAGLSTDYDNRPIANNIDSGKIWGWGHSFGLWTNDPNLSCIQQVASPFTSVAVFGATNVYATSQSSSCTSGNPGGPCIYHGGYSGSAYSLSNTSYGAELVVFDSITEDVYALGAAQRVWKNWFLGCTDDSCELTNSKCASGTVSLVQIAAKNGVVFGLDAAGVAYFFGGVDGNCWTPINQTGSVLFTSIATDNDSVLGPGVWGVDSSGNLWAAQ